jgi:hypothetical protein
MPNRKELAPNVYGNVMQSPPVAIQYLAEPDARYCRRQLTSLQAWEFFVIGIKRRSSFSGHEMPRLALGCEEGPVFNRWVFVGKCRVVSFSSSIAESTARFNARLAVVIAMARKNVRERQIRPLQAKTHWVRCTPVTPPQVMDRCAKCHGRKC